MLLQQWIVLLYTLPASQSAARLSFWRQLKRMGAVAMKTSAYVLPDGPEHDESLLWLAQQVRQAGGEATLLKSAEVDALSETQLKDLFHQAREADYREIIADAAKLKPAGRRKKAATQETEDAVLKLRKRFEAVRKVDFFDCPAAPKVQQLLDSLTAPAPVAERGGPVKAADFQSRKWQTRPRPELDRVASAWLIQRFIDPKAAFVFGRTKGEHKGAVTFDMVDADFGHEGDDCTFETLMRRFSLKAKGLRELSQIVHAADIADEKFARTEGDGLLAVLRGWGKQGMADAEILRRGMDLMDGLLSTLTTR